MSVFDDELGSRKVTDNVELGDQLLTVEQKQLVVAETLRGNGGVGELDRAGLVKAPDSTENVIG